MSELKADYITLGCKLNFAETSSLSDKLQARGIRRVTAGEHADICVINTCTVTETSNHKCRQAINRALREHPGTLMVVMGCYAQLAARQIAMMPGVDLVISMEHKSRAVDLILQAYEEKCSLCSTLNVQWSTVNGRRSSSLRRGCATRHTYLRSFVFTWRADALLPQGAGRLRLLLYLLCNTACAGTQP